jgi:hypothetical protein
MKTGQNATANNNELGEVGRKALACSSGTDRFKPQDRQRRYRNTEKFITASLCNRVHPTPSTGKS